MDECGDVDTGAIIWHKRRVEKLEKRKKKLEEDIEELDEAEEEIRQRIDLWEEMRERIDRLKCGHNQLPPFSNIPVIFQYYFSMQVVGTQ